MLDEKGIEKWIKFIWVAQVLFGLVWLTVLGLVIWALIKYLELI